MGYTKQSLKLLLKENQSNALKGKFLSIGKQSVAINQTNLLGLIEHYGYAKEDSISSFEKDLSTRNKLQYSDDSLIKTLFEMSYNCMDKADYEGADIIQDMNLPLKNKKAKYDAIYNGSCMDNLFNTYQFLVNTSELLNVGGRIFHIEAAGNVRGAFSMFSPEYFLSFYAINKYKRCEVYLIVSYDENSRYDLFCDWFKYSPYYTRNVPQDTDLEASRSVWGMMHVLVIAEKGMESTNHQIPTQLQYLEKDNCDWTQTYKKWNICMNPDLMLEDRNINLLPFNSTHFTYIGSELKSN